MDKRPDTAHSVSPDSGTHWSAPGAWRAAPGVFRIPLPLPMDGLKAINVYAIETPEGLTLIDGGWAIPVARELLESSLASVGYGIGDIKRFLVTHVHRDHYTQAVTLRKEVGAHVSLGWGDKGTLDLINDPDLETNPHVELYEAAGAPQIAQAWRGFGESDRPDLSLWEYPDTWLEGDRVLSVGERTIDAVHTPGHTQGHYVFADTPGGLLFSGDHVLPTITPSIGVEPVQADLALGDFMRSLARVRELPDLAVLPAHGPVAPSSYDRVDELLDHHEARLALSLEAVRGGAATPYEVAGELTWTRHEHPMATLDVFNAGMATLETQAHLDLLVARGQATLAWSDGVRRYAFAQRD